MYSLIDGKKVEHINEEYSTSNYKRSNSYYPTTGSTIENYADDNKCGTWIYIVSGIIILLIAILLIYWIFVNKNKSKLSSTKTSTKSSEQKFGFRFY
jgi:hypothetical protein